MAGCMTRMIYSYSTAPHIRRHGPSGWNKHGKYREWLRDEFAFRCVYCLEREVWRDMRAKMHIDHFEPQAIRPDLECEYTNLLYLCPACNSEKSDSILPDPCKIALGDCLQIHDDGQIEAKDQNAVGKTLIDELSLNDPLAIERRRIMIGMLRTLAEYNRPMFVEWMRYPKNLPNLDDKQNKPPHNSKPEGLAQSYFEKKRRGELPEVY
jgi:hypothetical protein